MFEANYLFIFLCMIGRIILDMLSFAFTRINVNGFSTGYIFEWVVTDMAFVGFPLDLSHVS